MTEKNSIDEYLNEVLKRCEAASRGPWKSDGFTLEIPSIGYFCRMQKPDAEFVANSITDLPRLARYAQKLRAVLKRIATTGDPEDDVDVAREALAEDVTK